MRARRLGDTPTHTRISRSSCRRPTARGPSEVPSSLCAPAICLTSSGAGQRTRRFTNSHIGLRRSRYPTPGRRRTPVTLVIAGFVWPPAPPLGPLRKTLGAPSRLLELDQVADAVVRLATGESLHGRVLVWWSEDEPRLIPWGDVGYAALV